MRDSRTIKTAILLIAVLCLVYPAFSGDKKGPNGPKVITGEVVEIHRAVQAEHGQIDEVVVGDGEGQMWRMRLMTPEGVPGAYQVGDLVRARVMWPEEPVDGDTDGTTDETMETAVMASESDSGKVALVRNMRNWRTGEKTVYRDGDGNLLQVQVRSQFKAAAEEGGHAVQTRTRYSQPETAGSGGGGSHQNGYGGGGAGGHGNGHGGGGAGGHGGGGGGGGR
jgi:hypothetical protein